MKKLILFLMFVSFQAQAQEVYNFYFQKKTQDAPAAMNEENTPAPAPQVVTMTPAKPELVKKGNKYVHLGLANWSINGPVWDRTENGYWNGRTTIGTYSFSGIAATAGYRVSKQWAFEGQGIFGNSKDNDQSNTQTIVSGAATFDAISSPVYGRTLFDLYVVAGGSYITNWYSSTGLHAALRGEFTLSDNFGLFLEYRKYLTLNDMFSKNGTYTRQSLPEQLTTLSVALNF